jgi:hypothetical protein
MDAIPTRIFLGCYRPTGEVEAVITFVLKQPPEKPFRHGQELNLSLDGSRSERIIAEMFADASQTPNGSVMLSTSMGVEACMDILARMKEVTGPLAATSS